jgi:hypothetical protein
MATTEGAQAEESGSAFDTLCDTLQELDKYEQQHIDFWDAMAAVAGHELEEAQRQEDIDRARASDFPQTLLCSSVVLPGWMALVTSM